MEDKNCLSCKYYFKEVCNCKSFLNAIYIITNDEEEAEIEIQHPEDFSCCYWA